MCFSTGHIRRFLHVSSEFLRKKHNGCEFSSEKQFKYGKMPASIGVNLRVTGHCRQGGRKYMEDFFSVAYQQTEDEKDLEYAFFGIYDGHGGGEAATFAKEHLMESIVRQKNFWSDKDEDVLKAIKDGYISTHYAMWKEQEKWPKTASGLPSTAGTTASVAFIRRGKIYIGHVGDSGIILGYQEPGNTVWKARALTKDHKPENASEMSRIESCGGKVVTKSGVPRVVWNRPRIGHKGPVRRSTPIDEIPFLAVARSLGDLWSYNSALDEFVVSPDPDTCCIPIDSNTFRCLIFGTDGLWNMISPSTAVGIVQVAEQHNEKTVLLGNDPQQVNDPTQQTSAGRTTKVWINPSKCLVERALERWSSTRMRADNTSVITLMLDPPGPPRAEVIRNQRLMQERARLNQISQQDGLSEPPLTNPAEELVDYPKSGLEIVTRYAEEPDVLSSTSNEVCNDNSEAMDKNEMSDQQKMQELQMNPQVGIAVNSQNQQLPKIETSSPKESPKSERCTEEYLNKIHQQMLNTQNTQKRVETNLEPPEEVSSLQEASQSKENFPVTIPDPQLQINEVSSSSNSENIPEEDLAPPCARCTRSHDVKRPQKSPQKSTKKIRSSSESPKRKTRFLRSNRKSISTKREHSDGNLLSTEALDARLAPGPSNLSIEPPQKLRRSRSLGPRDFTLRSSDSRISGRCLRDRDKNGIFQNRPSLLNSFRKLSTNQNRPFTPVRQAMQTRNRLKRLNK